MTQIKLIGFLDPNIILIVSKNMDWFFTELQDGNCFKQKLLNNDSLIDLSPLVDRVMVSIEFDNLFFI